jgi:hypothetical protein
MREQLNMINLAHLLNALARVAMSYPGLRGTDSFALLRPPFHFVVPGPAGHRPCPEDADARPGSGRGEAGKAFQGVQARGAEEVALRRALSSRRQDRSSEPMLSRLAEGLNPSLQQQDAAEL